MDQNRWKIIYSKDTPPRRLWTPIQAPPRPPSKIYIWLEKYQCFFNSQRIAKLLKPETAMNSKANAPDAFTPSGGIVNVNFTYVSGNSSDRLAEIKGWLNTSQSEIGINNAKAALHGDVEYPTTEVPEIDSLPPGLTGFRIDTAPTDLACPPAGLYWKLRPDIFHAISTGGGLKPPQEAYISEETYQSIVNVNHPRPMVWFTGNCRLAIRNESGELAWMVCYNNDWVKNPSQWVKHFDQATLACEQENEKTRRTNPEINLTIVHTGLGPLTYLELKSVFAEAALKGQQICTVLQSAPDGYQLMGSSPFGDYDTYMSGTDFAKYQNSRGDHPQPFIPLQAAGKVPHQVEDKPQQVVHVSTTHIVNAAKERNNLPNELKQQGSIMGVSATKIASDFGWQNPDTKVGNAGHDPTWPATSVMPAEWLHRSAFSWGGIDDPDEDYTSSDYRSSQVSHNLIFGSSETNSLMTRFEKSWQMLFRKETKLLTLNNNMQPNFTGDLTTVVIPLFDQPWLTTSMTYRLQLHRDSQLLGTGRNNFETTFYPFSRPLFTAVEAEADRGILALLWEKETKEQDTGTEDMGEADDIDG